MAAEIEEHCVCVSLHNAVSMRMTLVRTPSNDDMEFGYICSQVKLLVLGLA